MKNLQFMKAGICLSKLVVPSGAPTRLASKEISILSFLRGSGGTAWICCFGLACLDPKILETDISRASVVKYDGLTAKLLHTALLITVPSKPT